MDGMNQAVFTMDVEPILQRDTFLRDASEQLTRGVYLRTSTIERALRERGVVVDRWNQALRDERMPNGNTRVTVDLSIAEMHDATLLDFPPFA